MVDKFDGYCEENTGCNNLSFCACAAIQDREDEIEKLEAELNQHKAFGQQLIAKNQRLREHNTTMFKLIMDLREQGAANFIRENGYTRIERVLRDQQALEVSDG